jgi:hypothetical protein
MLAAAVLAAAPARALTRAEFEAARGSYELSDGRFAHLGGSPHRPRLQFGDGAAMALVDAGGGRIASADGRIELRLVVHANGSVSGLRLIQQR